MAQVERFQDCSGKNTYYRYDERQHLVAFTDVLNQTTTLKLKEHNVKTDTHATGKKAENVLGVGRAI